MTEAEYDMRVKIMEGNKMEESKITSLVQKLTQGYCAEGDEYSFVETERIRRYCDASDIELLPLRNQSYYATNPTNSKEPYYVAPKYFVTSHKSVVNLSFELFPENRHWQITTTHDIADYSCGAGLGVDDEEALFTDLLRKSPDMADAVELIRLVNEHHLFVVSPEGDTFEPMYAVENGWYWYRGTKHQDRSDTQLAGHFAVSLVSAKAIPDGLSEEEFSSYIDMNFRPLWKEAYERIITLWNKLPMWNSFI